MTDSLVPVSVACPCPGTPHADGDTVFLAPKMDLPAGILADAKVVEIAQRADGSSAHVQSELASLYLLFGVREWTFTDADGEPLPVTEAAVREVLLSDYDMLPVAEKADELYTKAVMTPLLKRMVKSSPPTPTNGSMSRKSGSSAKRPSRSKPSSTSTSPTVVTGPI